MKRAILKLALCLVLGVILNTGIAWWCIGSASWRGAWSAPGFDRNGSPPIVWLWPERVPNGAEPNARWVSVAFGAAKVEVSRQAPLKEQMAVSLSFAERVQRTNRAGWPLHCLETRDGYPFLHTWQPRFLTKDVWINSFEQGLCFTGPESQGQIVLPLLPRWPGFAINTLLCAALVWLAAATLVSARRTIRRRRGRCARCGYELRDLATCPECGHTTSSRGQPRS
jgi:hypothetical protein